jgi:hypothetical protein
MPEGRETNFRVVVIFGGARMELGDSRIVGDIFLYATSKGSLSGDGHEPAAFRHSPLLTNILPRTFTHAQASFHTSRGIGTHLGHNIPPL